tara:strand:- start:329 stop:1006 length:678 start_codon:yes stop_codon:yes gene_type:complete
MMLPLRHNKRELQLPSTGITLLEGPGFFGKEVRIVAQQWTTAFLSQGHAIHWIDGGNRFDPTQFFSSLQSLNCNTEDCLRRLYIGRGFTLHQLHALIIRIRHEIALTKAPIVVIDGIMSMFLDEQIRRFEARSILRHCLTLLQDVSAQCSVILLDGRTASNIHRQLKQTMRPYLSHELRAAWEDRGHTKLKFSGTNGQVILEMNTTQTGAGIRQLQPFTSIDLIE